jgi:hypothetical protein
MAGDQPDRLGAQDVADGAALAAARIGRGHLESSPGVRRTLPKDVAFQAALQPPDPDDLVGSARCRSQELANVIHSGRIDARIFESIRGCVAMLTMILLMLLMVALPCAVIIAIHEIRTRKMLHPKA